MSAWFLFFILFSVPLHAAEEVETLDELLKQVEESRFEESRNARARELQFEREKNKQALLLRQAQAKLKQLEVRAKKLENVFNENERQLSQLDGALKKKLGNFAEMFGVIKQVASETQGQLKESLISGERKGRTALLESLVKTKRIPTPSQIEKLWQVMLDELIAQGRISTFTGTLVDSSGQAREATITRIGAFVALHNGNYLSYLPQTQAYRLLGRQPAGKFLDAAEAIQERGGGGDDDGVIRAAIDPARGALLALLVETPSLTERLQQGGLVGYIIIVLACFGVGLGAWRLFVLSDLRRAVDRQALNLQTLSADNPLGRVLASIGDEREDKETLELKLNDAILRELPALESYLPLIKIFAAIAPLLGLLGTVTGMILTFQAITLFGTGDAKLMAGGISQALITTALGLMTAVPLILLHALAASRARDVRQVLEEQAAGLALARATEGAPEEV